jgi:hypothetical protein
VDRDDPGLGDPRDPPARRDPARPDESGRRRGLLELDFNFPASTDCPPSPS